MTLENTLNNPPPENTRTCKFGPWLASQPEDDRNAIHRAFDNPDIPARHIYRTLLAVGCPSAESSIRSHRRGECQNCERKRNGQHV
jgi:hypothetical protein